MLDATNQFDSTNINPYQFIFFTGIVISTNDKQFCLGIDPKKAF